MSSTKKKVIISLSSLVAVILIAACAFVAVWAARNARVTSNFNVTYTAIHVKATITGQYQVKGDEPITIKYNSSENSIVFNGEEATNNSENRKSFDEVTGILLSETKDNVVFTYTITNDGTNAFDVYFKASYDGDTNTNYTYTVNGDAASVTTGTATNLGSVAASDTMTVTITISIANLDENVDITSGTFEFGLNDALSA